MKPEDEAIVKEFPDEHFGVLEYSVFGWFKYVPVENRAPNTVLLRLTNNEESYRADAAQVGDRTLAIILSSKEY